MLDHLFLNEGGGHLLPFLWLHGEDHTVLAEEIEKIYESGARSLCIESRPHPDFAGPGWWKDVDFILEECRRRGMRMYVLDDVAFPTDYAAGAVADADQALHKQYLICDTLHIVLQMLGFYGFQLALADRMFLDAAYGSFIRCYRTVAQRTGLQFFLHPHIQHIA